MVRAFPDGLASGRGGRDGRGHGTPEEAGALVGRAIACIRQGEAESASVEVNVAARASRRALLKRWD